MANQQKPFKPAKTGSGEFVFEHNGIWPEADDANIVEPPYKRGGRRNSGIFEEVINDKFSWTKEEFLAMKVGSDEDGEEEENSK